MERRLNQQIEIERLNYVTQFLVVPSNKDRPILGIRPSPLVWWIRVAQIRCGATIRLPMFAARWLLTGWFICAEMGFSHVLTQSLAQSCTRSESTAAFFAVHQSTLMGRFFFPARTEGDRRKGGQDI